MKNTTFNAALAIVLLVVIVGGIERSKYQLNPSLVDKFGKIGEKVFEQGSIRIYRVGQVTASNRVP